MFQIPTDGSQQPQEGVQDVKSEELLKESPEKIVTTNLNFGFFVLKIHLCLCCVKLCKIV